MFSFEKKYKDHKLISFEIFMLPFFLFFASVGAINLYGYYAKKTGDVTNGHVEWVLGVSRTTKLMSILYEGKGGEIYVVCQSADLTKGAAVEVGANWYDRSIALGFKNALYLKREGKILCGDKDYLGGVSKSTAVMSVVFMALFFICLVMVIRNINTLWSK